MSAPQPFDPAAANPVAFCFQGCVHPRAAITALIPTMEPMRLLQQAAVGETWSTQHMSRLTDPEPNLRQRASGSAQYLRDLALDASQGRKIARSEALAVIAHGGQSEIESRNRSAMYVP